MTRPALALLLAPALSAALAATGQSTAAAAHAAPAVSGQAQAAAPAAPAAPAAITPSAPQRTGSHLCARATTRCEGTLTVPLDRADPQRGTLRVGFTFLPRTDRTRPALGTVAGVQGGPGLANPLEQWQQPLADLLDRRNLLVMDNRGVGRSGYLSCPDLSVDTPGGTSPAALRACARALGPTAALYGTAAATDDLDDLRAALAIPALDVYSTSYGTFFAQVYAQRHPARARTTTLAAPQRIDTDPLERSNARWPLTAMNRTCADTPQCHRSITDPAGDWQRVVADVRRTRRTRPAGIKVLDLARLQARYPSGGIGRELPAAARAWLRGDRAPLRRLVAQQQAPADAGAATGSAAAAADAGGPAPDTSFSSALLLAVNCGDTPVPFDRSADPRVRRAQWDRAAAALPAGSYGPFPAAEWTAANPLLQELCIHWDVRTANRPAVAPARPFPAVPALVLAGGADNTTPPSDARVIASRFLRGRLVTVPFAGHAVSFGDPTCASGIVTDFIRTADPQQADSRGCTDTSFRPVGSFPLRVRDVPRTALNTTLPVWHRRLLAAAVATVADAAARRAPADQYVPLEQQPGLRGGTLRLRDTATGARIDLERVRYVRDLAVTGTLTGTAADDLVRAAVTVTGPHGTTGRLRITLDPRRPTAAARVSGRIG